MVIPVDARFIQKNIAACGNTCTVTEIAVTIGTDEYRTKSEVESSHANIPCYVNVLSYEDEMVKSGIARAGDLRFWFDYSYESYFTLSGDNKLRITWNSREYEVYNILPFKAVGDNLMIIEVLTRQI